ncbi:TPA_exp: hypothetical protein A8136_0117 [Trichophyton benhamiae CBS 112371]|nr:TPA_exp: hypothetical protein A8136_0117 [Trichophyton benhamiae CBS 112371]
MTTLRTVRRPLDPGPSDPLPPASNALYIEHILLVERSEWQTAAAAAEADTDTADIPTSSVVFELDCTDVESLPWSDAAV